MNSDDIKKQLAKLKRDKRLLWLGILFFVIVVFWILASIFATSKTSSVSPELRELAKSFVPRLESNTFEEIMSKRLFSEEELSSFPVYIIDKKSTNGNSEIFDIIAPIVESEQMPLLEPEVASNSSIESNNSIDESASEAAKSTGSTKPIDQATSSAGQGSDASTVSN